MLRNLIGVITVISVIGISFASFYLSIEMAKRQVAVWRRGSTYMFVRSNGMGGIQRRAREVWIKQLGYDELEAAMIARYQSRAGLTAFVGCTLLCLIIAAIFQHFDPACTDCGIRGERPATTTGR
ncbi:hypothetical protein [Bradyrhizobium sp. CCBAU 11361]|uniref:hypothetical protein n=1 Tax=Bradyrhizobium sp. CCBAU 11361 TaxID=1630812 RepID=UPI002303837A|nr:hypothetical protein [Bradyrhizobium sp. CCBAU 11361]MDA9490625.1 hypothetical protein [Bradyrhizobium sp. CCBAU 11361]